MQNKSENHMDNIFQLGPFKWDTVQAQEITKTQTPNEKCNILHWMAIAEILEFNLIDLQKSATDEVIIAKIPGDSIREETRIIIAGWRRLIRNYGLGIKVMPAHLLTMEESTLCRRDSYRPIEPVRRRPPKKS